MVEQIQDAVNAYYSQFEEPAPSGGRGDRRGRRPEPVETDAAGAKRPPAEAAARKPPWRKPDGAAEAGAESAGRPPEPEADRRNSLVR